MSTSNISVLEKSLLKEFFKEDSAGLEPGTSTQVKSETIEQHHIIKQTKAEEIEHNTPPLASSTLVNSNNRGAKPKKLTKSTSSTSLQEKFEKFAQTSLRKLPTVSTKEVQCSMSCSSNSLLEGTINPLVLNMFLQDRQNLIHLNHQTLYPILLTIFISNTKTSVNIPLLLA